MRVCARDGDPEIDARDVKRGHLFPAALFRVPLLHEFLSTNRAAIVARAREKVVARPAPRATEEELASGIPLFLRQLTETLRVSHVSSAVMADSATAYGHPPTIAFASRSRTSAAARRRGWPIASSARLHSKRFELAWD
jgi:hypothetical protein